MEIENEEYEGSELENEEYDFGEDGKEIENNREEPEDEEKDEPSDEEKDTKEAPKTEDELLEDAMLDRKVKVKINGEERTMSIRELQKVKQLEEASHAKLREAAEARNMANQLLSLAKDDPKKFFQVTGKDPYEFAQSTMLERLEMMGMTEEQRKSLELEKENKTLKQRQQEIERKQQEVRFQEEVEKEYQQLQKEVDQAWESSGLPQNDNFRGAIAQVMIADRQEKIQQAQMQGLDPRQIPADEFLTAEKAAAIVKGNWQKSLNATLSSMDAEAILGLLGEETTKAIKKVFLKRASEKTSPKYASGPGKKPASQRRMKQQPLTEKEYREWQEKLAQSM